MALLAVLLTTGAYAGTKQYTYDELGRVTRVLDPAGADVRYGYDAAGNVTLRQVINDSDGDGVTNAQDCAPTDGNVFPGAPEVNDGLDNQCPGDRGYGYIDELEGALVWTSKSSFSWTAQPLATVYEVAKASRSDFSTDCGQWYEISAQAVHSDVPAVGIAFFYLVRPVLPHVGSWGGRSSGVERTVCP